MALLTSLLFSGRIASAGPPRKTDTSAPTTPTNLVVTAVGDSTVSLKWNPATDNSGKFTYRVKVIWPNSPSNVVQTVGQTQTTYTVQYLAPFSKYSFAVYAVDGSGNRSGESNLVTADTLGDTIPPSAPVLQAVTLGPSRVQLTWTKSVDNLPNYCCTYALTRNGSPLTQHINAALAPSGHLSVIIRHLPPGTVNTFTVTAIDYTGRNKSTSNSASAETWPSTDTTPPSVPTNLHVISFDNGGGEAWLGWIQATDDTDAQNNIEYEIYVNGVLSPLPVSAGVDFDFVYTLPPCENTFTVKAVDQAGNTSAASTPVKVKQWCVKSARFMKNEFPPAVPEIPVSDMDQALGYYERQLGFNIDWGGAEGGIAGISKGHCRMFLTDSSFRAHHGNAPPVMIWLNLHSKEEVEELYESWKAAETRIISSPESKPWKLHEFTASDLDGNLFRVFYDFSRDS